MSTWIMDKPFGVFVRRSLLQPKWGVVHRYRYFSLKFVEIIKHYNHIVCPFFQKCTKLQLFELHGLVHFSAGLNGLLRESDGTQSRKCTQGYQLSLAKEGLLRVVQQTFAFPYT